MQFHEHDGYKSELKAICKKQKQLSAAITDGVGKVRRLLAIQFDPLDPQTVIPPGKIHRISGYENWELWKVEVVLTGTKLRPNQWPRLWFVVSGENITFLNITTHTQNYDNNTMDKVALERISEYY